jgi:cell division septation protein DedD
LRSEWIAGGLRGAVRDIAVGEAAGGPDSIVAVVWRQAAGDAGAGQQSAIVAIDPRQPVPPVETAGAAPAAVGADEGGGPTGPFRAPPVASREEPARRKTASVAGAGVSPPPSAASGKASPAPPSAGGGASWTVQVAALRSEADAAQLSEELRRKGLAARIEKVDLPDKGLWFRVRAGAFASREEARGTLERLRAHGFAPLLVPTRNGR